MRTLPSHFHTAALTACAIALGATIAAVSAASLSDLRVTSLLQSFILGGPEPSFDLQAFVSHPCFTIAGNEAKTCAQDFGISESLQSMLNNGTVGAYLRQQGITDSRVPGAAAPSPAASTSTSSTSVPAPEPTPAPKAYQETGSIQMAVTERATIIWKTCKERYRGGDVFLCHARNVKLLNRLDVPVEGNVF